MESYITALAADLALVHTRSPVVLNLTNYVAMDLNANALLALGASPIMAQAEEELEELVMLAGSVVLNIGTLDSASLKVMAKAAGLARALGKPVVLDPVGAGASRLRTEAAQSLLASGAITVVRGNASEIASVFGVSGGTKGVDSVLRPEAVVAIAREVVNSLPLTIVVSGETDYIVGKNALGKVANGTPLMTRVTAMGCTSTALIGAFLAVSVDPVLAATHAMAVMGVAGEIADAIAEGPGTFRTHFVDALSMLDEKYLAAARVELT